MIVRGDKSLPDDEEPDEIGHAKKAAFLAAYAQLGNLTAAARASDVHRQRHYEWMKNDPEYPERFRQAHAEACESLEAEARRRAVNGTLKPVFHKGQKCGTIREYSDTLLIFLMKGAMPEKYRERFEHSGPGGGPIGLSHTSGEATREALENDPDYIEFVETKRLTQSGAMGGESLAGPLANGKASRPAQPGTPPSGVGEN